MVHPPHTHPHLPPPRGDPWNRSKFNNTSVETPPPMGGCIVWWVGGWVDGLKGGSGQMTKNLINVDPIKIIKFCLKINDL